MIARAKRRQAPPPATATTGQGAPARPDALPRHVAIIMDGNGRRAGARDRSRSDGHRAGYRNIEPVLQRLRDLGVPYVTLFGFSTENWERPDEEVSGLLDLLALAIDEQAVKLHRNSVRIVHIGRADRLSLELREKVRRAVELTAGNTGMTLCVAFDYGGRDDIVQAVRRMAESGLNAGEITDEAVSAHLYTAGVPDPDLVVRTGGEFRLSNFLLWQSAYAEFYSTPCNWPDFDAAELGKALDAYASRQRRFGRAE
jgi:undecaprenyl diphosphate synthase